MSKPERRIVSREEFEEYERLQSEEMEKARERTQKRLQEEFPGISFSGRKWTVPKSENSND